MTEKRFKHHMGLICEKKDGEYYSFTIREVCDLLNNLHEEKEYWKQKYKQEVEKHSIITAGVDKEGNWHRIPKEE